MSSKSKSAVKVIAYAIEKDTDSLKQLLTRNGILLEANVTKDQLQQIVTKALIKSKTFRDEFKNWVFERTDFHHFANVTGSFSADPTIGGGIGFIPGSSGAYQTTNSQTQQTFGGLTINPAGTSATSAGTGSPATTPTVGAWHMDLNTLLDFAKDGLNTFSTVSQSKSEAAISNNALEIERLRLQNEASPKSSSNTTVIVVVALISVAAIIGGFYFIKKQ